MANSQQGVVQQLVVGAVTNARLTKKIESYEAAHRALDDFFGTT
jgi:hypothetical protein